MTKVASNFEEPEVPLPAVSAVTFPNISKNRASSCSKRYWTVQCSTFINYFLVELSSMTRGPSRGTQH